MEGSSMRQRAAHGIQTVGVTIAPLDQRLLDSRPSTWPYKLRHAIAMRRAICTDHLYDFILVEWRTNLNLFRFQIGA